MIAGVAAIVAGNMFLWTLPISPFDLFLTSGAIGIGAFAALLWLCIRS